MKEFDNLILVLLVAPFILIISIIVLPIVLLIIIFTFIESIIDKIKLKKYIKLNNDKMFFLFAEYNNFDFSDYFTKRHKDITCLNVDENDVINSNIFNYTNQYTSGKSYPRIVKIKDDQLLIKNQYGNFKGLAKNIDNKDDFFKILESSIKNIRNE